jgi:hypothetical protein
MMKTQLAMNKVSFACLSGAVVKTERWGFLGFSRYCVVHELKNGPWEAWEGEYLQVKGGYRDGFPDGEWNWFNKDGSRIRQSTYALGKEQILFDVAPQK